MPRVRFKPLLIEIQGTMYDVVFKKSSSGKPILSKKPDMSKVEWSPAQKSNRGRFGEAVAAVQAALADPTVRARYERKARKLGKRVRDAAMSDYLAGKDLYGRKRKNRE